MASPYLRSQGINLKTFFKNHKIPFFFSFKQENFSFVALKFLLAPLNKGKAVLRSPINPTDLTPQPPSLQGNGESFKHFKDLILTILLPSPCRGGAGGEVCGEFVALNHFSKLGLKWQHLGLMLATFIAVLLIGIYPVLTQQPVPVKVLIQALEGTQWQPLIADFQKKNPNIRIEVIKGPNNTNLIEDLYTSAFLLGDSPYDLVYMDIVWVQKFAAAGWLQDLTDKADPKVLATYVKADVEGGKYEGKLYRMPFRTDGGMLYYRTDLLKKLGAKPPETFQELIQTSQQLQQKDLAQWGYLWQGKQYEGLAAVFTEVLEGYGGFWVNPDTNEVGLDQPSAIQAVEFLRSTLTEGISPPGVTTYSEDETRRLFQNGNTAFLRNWPYVYALASDSEIAGKFAIKPMVHAPGKSSGACLGGWGFGISKTSHHPAETWKVIEYFNNPDVQRRFFLDTGYVPSRRSLFTDPQLVARYSYLPQLLTVIEQAVLRPPIAQYAQASDILQRYLSAALTGSRTPEDAMKAAAQETRDLLEIKG